MRAIERGVFPFVLRLYFLGEPREEKIPFNATEVPCWGWDWALNNGSSLPAVGSPPPHPACFLAATIEWRAPATDNLKTASENLPFHSKIGLLLCLALGTAWPFRYKRESGMESGEASILAQRMKQNLKGLPRMHFNQHGSPRRILSLTCTTRHSVMRDKSWNAILDAPQMDLSSRILIQNGNIWILSKQLGGVLLKLISNKYVGGLLFLYSLPCRRSPRITSLSPCRGFPHYYYHPFIVPLVHFPRITSLFSWSGLLQ